jgi:hypothetical protein
MLVRYKFRFLRVTIRLDTNTYNNLSRSAHHYFTTANQRKSNKSIYQHATIDFAFLIEKFSAQKFWIQKKKFRGIKVFPNGFEVFTLKKQK